MKKSKHVWGLVGFIAGTFFGGRVYSAIRKVVKF